MMATTREAGRRGKRQGLGFAAVCLFTLVLAGCSGQQSHLQGDPLFGEYGLKQQGPSSPPPASAAPSKMQTSVAPIPPAQFSSTPAALAAGPLPGARPLSIDGSRQPAGTILPTSAPGVTPKPVVQPVPREAPARSPGAAPANSTWGPQAPVSGEAAMLQQLRVRGVLHWKVDTLPEGVRLSVIVPSRTQPDAARTYEATGRDLDTALQAILQKLDAAR